MANTGDTFNRAGWPDPRKWVCYDKSNGNETYGHTDPDACHRYTADAVNVDGLDALQIKATRLKSGEKWWSSGFLSSRDANCYYPLFGTIKIEATLPQASGIWPGIWLRAKNGGATRAEVDIAEVFFAGGDQVSQHLHFPATTGRSVFGKGMKLPIGPHIYWVKIVPEGTTKVKFTMGVDAKVAGSYIHPNRAALTKGCDLNEFWDVALNLAVSNGKWTGKQTNTLSPQTMRVDWVQWAP